MQWIDEEVVPSSRSNGTVRAYSHIVDCIKALPLGKRKLRTVKAEHLQKYFDSLTNVSSMRIYSYAAVFPKQLITFTTMGNGKRRRSVQPNEARYARWISAILSRIS